MRYTLAEREDLARRREQWLLRTAQGEDPAQVRRALKLAQSVRALEALRPRYEAEGRTWQVLLERRHGKATKGTPAVKAFVAKVKAKQPDVTAAVLVEQIWERFEITISLNRLNELLKQEGLSNPVGRPPQAARAHASEPAERDVDHAGAFFPPGSAKRTRRARGGAPRS
jgi:transposase